MPYLTNACVAAAAAWWWFSHRPPAPVAVYGVFESRRDEVGSKIGGRITEVFAKESALVDPEARLNKMLTEFDHPDDLLHPRYSRSNPARTKPLRTLRQRRCFHPNGSRLRRHRRPPISTPTRVADTRTSIHPSVIFLYKNGAAYRPTQETSSCPARLPHNPRLRATDRHSCTRRCCLHSEHRARLRSVSTTLRHKLG